MIFIIILRPVKKMNKPKALIADTIKGKGFSFSENNNDWHHSVLTKNLYEKALEEIGLKIKLCKSMREILKFGLP